MKVKKEINFEFMDIDFTIPKGYNYKWDRRWFMFWKRQDTFKAIVSYIKEFEEIIIIKAHDNFTKRTK